MARSDNCFNMHVQHIQWKSDSLIYYFGNSKGNQTGDRSNDPWYVYSNPNNPTIFSVLALAEYFFSLHDILTTNSKRFPGNHQYVIFLNIFHRIICVISFLLTNRYQMKVGYDAKVDYYYLVLSYSGLDKNW